MPKTLWIGTDPEPDDRSQITISLADYDATERLDRCDHEGVEVFDYRTNKYVTIRWASCGLSCRCAMEFVNQPTTRRNTNDRRNRQGNQ